MSTEPSNPCLASDPTPQLCRFCKEPINTGAIYCKICENFQTTSARWKNDISFSALISSLPLFALIYSFVHDRTSSAYSKVKALPIQCRIDQVAIGLTNLGNRPAVVADGTLRRTSATGTSDWALTNPAKEGAQIIAPSKPQITSFGIGSSALGQPPTASPGEACRYTVTLDVLEFGEVQQRKEKLTCPCPVG